MNWFLIFAMRLAGGERLEKARNVDYRIWFSAFLLFPVLIFVFGTLGKPLLDKSLLVVWLWVLANAFLFILLWWAASRLPAHVSLALGVIAWVLLFTLDPLTA